MRNLVITVFSIIIFPTILMGNNFHIFTGPYLPEMPAILYNGKKYSYQNFYGKSGSFMTILHYDYSLIKKFGELSIAGETGFFLDRGKTLIESNSGLIPSGESLTMYIIPINLGLIYYLQYLHNQIFVPFLEGGGSYWLFDEKRERGSSTSGAKRGFFYGAGIKFLMDILEPSAATSMKIDYGIQHTYIIGGYRIYTIDKPSGFVLSDKNWYVGLSFNF